MTNKQEVFEFDSRRKVLKRTIIDEDQIMEKDKVLGKYHQRNVQEYDLEGIKWILGELKNQEDQVQRFLADRNRAMESSEHNGELTEEEKKLNDMLISLQAKKKFAEAQAQHANALPGLDEVRKQRKAIYDALGTFRNLVE